MSIILQNLSFETSGKELMLTARVSPQGDVLSEQSISQFISSSPYNQLELDRSQIKAFVSHCLSVQEGEVVLGDDDQIEMAIGQVKDASLIVNVSKDKMQADVEVTTALGGKKIDLEQIKLACKDAGIKFGLKTSLVNQLLEACAQAEPGSVILKTVAKGIPAVNGKNAKLKPLVQLFSEKMRQPKLLEDGRADLRDLGNIETVEVGTQILKKLPATSGKNGRNILGEELEPIPGTDTDIQVTESTQLSVEDPNVLLAAKAGLVRFNGQLMEVDDVLVYKQLDPKQGNIKFKGSVVIRGDVAPDMKLVATGDVIIGGFVECATVKCGGELTIVSGASGRIVDNSGKGIKDPKYNCTLLSGEQINLAFANQCEITAKRLVSVKKQISHCNVEAESMIVGSGPKPNGQISGGRYYLCKRLQAGIIGTESGVNCDISLNRTYDIFMLKEAELSARVDAVEEEIAKYEAEFNRVMDPKVKAQWQAKIDGAQIKLDKYSLHRSALMTKRREFMDKVQVDIFRTLYPKVTFYIANRVQLTDVQKGPSKVRLREFELVIEPS